MSYGRELRKRRRAVEFSVDDLAEFSKLDADRIKAIEAGSVASDGERAAIERGFDEDFWEPVEAPRVGRLSDV